MSRKVKPLQQDDLAPLQNARFQYMIGNTDFSAGGQHNEKLPLQKIDISLPYDFDMSRLVNTSYATISGMANIDGSIDQVTQRVYKCYKRDEALLQKVRQDYIANTAQLFDVVDGLREFFDMPGQYVEASNFSEDFFEVPESDTTFQKRVVERTRTR